MAPMLRLFVHWKDKHLRERRGRRHHEILITNSANITLISVFSALISIKRGKTFRQHAAAFFLVRR